VNTIDALRRAGEEYRQRLVQVGRDQWNLPSVCEGWTVKELADHVLGGNRFTVPLLGGASADTAFSIAVDGDFDDDIVALFDESMAAQLEAFAVPGALDVEVAHPAGATSGITFAGLRTGDLLLHAWDLARSIGVDDSLNSEVVEQVWQVYEPRLNAGAIGSGGFGDGATGTLGDDAALVLRLLDLTGRRP
jgi:uncharacterized protein (TIGR03086 family)